jgi:hypothetical protein
MLNYVSKFHILTITCILLLLVSSGTRAAESINVRFDNAFVDLPYPDGYCILGETEAEKRLLQWQKDMQLDAGNKLLGQWITCEDKQKIQSGTLTGSLEKWVIIVGTLLGDGGTELALPNFDPEEYKRLMTGDVDLKNLMKLAQKSIADNNKKHFDNENAVFITEPIDLGVLSITDSVHKGMIFNTGNQEFTVPVTAVTSTILVSGIPLSSYFYSIYRNKKTIKNLLSEAEHYSAKLVHSN